MGILRTNKDYARLEDRLRAVEEQCVTLDRASRSLKLEYTDLYDKVSHQMSRMAKRDALAKKENGPDPEEETITPYDHLDPVSKSIMLRRARMGRV